MAKTSVMMRDFRPGVAKLSITDIFRFPVLGDLAKAVEGKLGPAPAAPAAAPAPAPAVPAAQDAPTGRADAMAARRAMRARRRQAR